MKNLFLVNHTILCVCKKLRENTFFYVYSTQDVEIGSPKQTYYMGEDPYGDAVVQLIDVGKNRPPQQTIQPKIGSSLLFNGSSQQLSAPPSLPSHHHHTLGRYSKSTTRLPQSHGPPTAASTVQPQHVRHQPHQQRHYQDYRSTQTLPRKLSSTNNATKPPTTTTVMYHYHPTAIAQSQTVAHNNPALSPPPAYSPNVHIVPMFQNTGPAKPARTYNTNANMNSGSKISSNKIHMNRSKSFNVHGLNGSPHHHSAAPIFIEKKNASPVQQQRGARSALMYRSTPQLLHDETHQHHHLASPQLKSPSIVNLISRSHRDLRRIAETRATTDSEEHALDAANSNNNNTASTHNNSLLIQQHRRNSEVGSRIQPAPIANRDTVAIVRGHAGGGGGGCGSSGASTTDDYYSGESFAGQNNNHRAMRNRRTTLAAAPMRGKFAVRMPNSNRN